MAAQSSQPRVDSGADPDRVAIFGSINTDLTMRTNRIPEAGETLTAGSFSTGTGGKGANQAVAVARLSKSTSDARSVRTDRELKVRAAKDFDSVKAVLAGGQGNVTGVEVDMVGAVGHDEFGVARLKDLAYEGVGITGIQAEGLTTGVANIIVEESTGENRILLSTGANQNAPLDYMCGQITAGHYRLIVLQLEVPLAKVVDVMRCAYDHKVPVIFNPAPAIAGIPREAFKNITHLILNETEAAILSDQPSGFVENTENLRSTARSFIDWGVEYVTITLGGKGSYFMWKDGQSIREGRQLAEKVDAVVDTTGAGDTFIGAYALQVLSALPSALDMEEAVHWASRAAAVSVQRSGGMVSIPFKDEV